MSQINLTKGYSATVDPEDYDWLMQIGRWAYGSSGYALHRYTDSAGKRREMYMHRLVMERKLGYPIPKNFDVDHVSGAIAGKEARLDNRRLNLRLSTKSQNQAHKGRQKNTDIFKGVTRVGNRYEARIKYGPKRLHLGRFDTPREAALIYDSAARLLYHEFAGPNFGLNEEQPLYLAVRLEEILARYGIVLK